MESCERLWWQAPGISAASLAPLVATGVCSSGRSPNRAVSKEHGDHPARRRANRSYARTHLRPPVGHRRRHSISVSCRGHKLCAAAPARSEARWGQPKCARRASDDGPHFESCSRTASRLSSFPRSRWGEPVAPDVNARRVNAAAEDRGKNRNAPGKPEAFVVDAVLFEMP